MSEEEDIAFLIKTGQIKDGKAEAKPTKEKDEE